MIGCFYYKVNFGKILIFFKAENARKSCPAGMSENDVDYWLTRISVAAAFMAISIEKDELAISLFEKTETKWLDLLKTFAAAGFLDGVLQR